MDANIHLRWHFAVPIYEVALHGFVDHQAAIVAKILALREADADAVRSDPAGWRSSDQLHLTDDPDLAFLVRAVRSASARCVDGFHADGCAEEAATPERSPRRELTMTSAWANVNLTGDFQLPRVHLPSDWSAVVYVGTERTGERARHDVGGHFLFFDPLPLGDRWRRGHSASYAPRDGTMLLFPAYLMHMIAPHRGSAPRVSMAFNFVSRASTSTDRA